MDTIPALAEGLESLRQKLLVYRYQFLHFRSARWQAADELRDVKPDLKQFDELVAEIKSKTRERKSLADEKKQIPMWNLLKKNELTKRITQLTEELEELRSEKTRLLARFAYTADKEMKQAKDWAKLKEKVIDDLSAKEKQCEAALDDTLAEFQQLSQKADAQNPDELWTERLKLREPISRDTKEKLKAHFDSSFSPLRLQNAQKDIGMYLEQDEQSLRQYADRQRRREQEIRRAQKAQKPKKREHER